MDKIKLELDLPPSVYEKLGDFIISKVNEAWEAKAKEINKSRTMYTRDETAKLLRISLTTLDKLRDDGALKAETAGRKVLYSQIEIDRYLNRNR